jgi:hypothetical protein
MRHLGRVTIALAACAALAGSAWAHDEETGGPTFVVDHWRDNFVPFFDAGDPKTRHDSDPDNDESRDDVETRRSAQRWRDEVRTDGSTDQEVGDGCMETFCVAAADQSGDLARVDHSLAVGPSTVEGDRNAVVVEVLGAGAEVDLGGSNKMGFAAVPDVSQAEVTPSEQVDDPAEREAPDRLSVMTAGDHSMLGAAHSNSDHRPAPIEGNHDAHGGSVWVDLFLPTEDSPTRVRDTRVGIVVLDHLGCQFGCSDEYHTFYAADPERTIFQVGEMPGQAEFVARDPDRWLFGFGPSGETPEAMNPVVVPLSEALFDDLVNPNLVPHTNAATGVGDAASACCAPDPAQDGQFCNRNPGGALMTALENGGTIAGCVELASGDCVGGALTADGFQGCMVMDGQPTVDGEEVSEEECTEAAAAACCENEACL